MTETMSTFRLVQGRINFFVLTPTERFSALIGSSVDTEESYAIAAEGAARIVKIDIRRPISQL